MRETLTFLLNGERVALTGLDPTTTVLQWLRETRRLTGTKEGCAAGDCGACTVLAGHLEGERIVYAPLNACITLMPMLEGLSLLTVESVSGAGGALHPCQQAMVDCHGSQCGFCTPGFVMSLYGAYLSPGAHTPAHVDDLLAGNLCRCTGYAPIRKAAAQMYASPRPDWDQDRHGAHLVAALAAIQHDDEVELTGQGRTMRIVATEDQFAAYLATHPDARIVAGATDVGLWLTKQFRELPRLLHLRRASPHVERGAPRREIIDGRQGRWVGAFATHAAAGESDALGTRELHRRFAGPQVRAAGTIGGNIANASPIGDLAPAFLAQGAIVHLRKGKARRQLPLDQFFLAYGKTALEPGEFIEGFWFDEPEVPRWFAVYKVSKRFDDDISAVCGAFEMSVDAGTIVHARIAYGGMAATPMRARSVEGALVGQPWSRATIDAARAVFAQDFTPISDMRASAAYRMDVARNLLVRFYIEHAAPTTKTRLVGANAAFGG